MNDFDNVTDLTLCDLARQAFELGLQHGRKLSNPWTAAQVWHRLGLASCTCRRGHKTKIRQVYGAGFDIAEMMRRVNA